MKLLILLLVAYVSVGCNGQCVPSVTTVSGTHAPGGAWLCSGQLIFEDNFDDFDLSKWSHEITLNGGYNNEFQWYTNNRENSYTEGGLLYLYPTMTAEHLGEDFLTGGVLRLDGSAPAYEHCTSWDFCEQYGSPDNIIMPVKSARIRTHESFSFKYGRVEIRAQLPAGDWLWPALWFMPTYSVYGQWPASGEIDLMESRGNRHMYLNGQHIGTEQVGSTLHFGPFAPLNGWYTSHFSRNSPSGAGFDQGFHLYQMEWSPDGILMSVDNVDLGWIPVGEGFWQRGGFDVNNPELENVWRNGDLMAPFDQEFHFIINLAAGGDFFPDGVDNPGGKPFGSRTDFWYGRDQWFPTWYLGDRESAFKIDYVRAWAL